MDSQKIENLLNLSLSVDVAEREQSAGIYLFLRSFEARFRIDRLFEMIRVK